MAFPELFQLANIEDERFLSLAQADFYLVRVLLGNIPAPKYLSQKIHKISFKEAYAIISITSNCRISGRTPFIQAAGHAGYLGKTSLDQSFASGLAAVPRPADHHNFLVSRQLTHPVF
jgi:hypothetical protein